MNEAAGIRASKVFVSLLFVCVYVYVCACVCVCVCVCVFNAECIYKVLQYKP